MRIPKILFQKIFLYIPNKYNNILSNYLKDTKFFSDFYQEENLYLINIYKSTVNTMVNTILNSFNKEMDKILLKFKP